MTTLRILMADDEPLARLRLRSLLDDCKQPRLKIVAEARNANEVLDGLQTKNVNVLLLDIHMPGMSGMELARMLERQAQSCAIIFVTAHAQYAVQAFEVSAVDYLLKPVRLARLQEALRKALDFLSADESADRADPAHEPDGPCLTLVEQGRSLRIPLADIVYLKADHKYTCVYTLAGHYLLHDSLNQLESALGDAFIRVHRNALVARAFVRGLEKKSGAWMLQLFGTPEELSVSRRQLPGVRQSLGL